MGHEFMSSLDGQFWLDVSHDIVVRYWSSEKLSGVFDSVRNIQFQGGSLI